MSALVELLRAAGLTGRGGAEFPTAVKIEMAEAYSADLIVNACDGEVDARKDGWVVAHHLDGLLDGARLVAGDHFRVAAHRGSATLAALERAGVDALEVPSRYVASEESALVSLAHGGLARPLMRWTPVTAGSRRANGRRLPPTLVLNTETVWHIAQIADRGARWFRSYGTPHEPGPRLVTVVDGVRAPGVYDAHSGLVVDEIFDLAGGLTVPARALWLGGLGGGFLAGRYASTTQWSRAGTARRGIRPGAGTIRVIDARFDPWSIVQTAMDHAAGESAGQCGPCMFGIPALRDDLTMLRDHPDPETARRLSRRLGELTGRGACHFPDGVAGFLISALDVFGDPTPAGGRHHRAAPRSEWLVPAAADGGIGR